MPVPVSKDILNRLNKADAKFNLDISGVAGFFGGDVAVSAMGSIHLYRSRRWLGWYNSPGSYEIAKSYGVLCQSRLWDAIYPGVNVDPAVLFGLNDKDGPSYRGVCSGTVMAKTGHLGYLLAAECKLLEVGETRRTQGRKSRPVAVTVVDLGNVHPESSVDLVPQCVDNVATGLAIVPILITMAACVLCVIVASDWFSFGLILFGALVSGFSCIVIGSATLKMERPEPAPNSPPGHGVLGTDGSDMIILLGSESTTNTITKGEFHLQFGGEPQYHMIGICALFLTLQFLAQLLIIPIGTVFGQLMFIASLASSWCYTAYLSSIDREVLQRDLLNSKQILDNPSKLKYTLGTRTMAVVFTLNVLKDSLCESESTSEKLPQETRNALGRLLHDMLPNATDDWAAWKEALLSYMFDGFEMESTLAAKSNPFIQSLLEDTKEGLRLYHVRLQDRRNQSNAARIPGSDVATAV